MSSLALSGVFSGIDTTAIVAGLMAVNRRPLNRLAARKIEYETKQTAMDDLKSRLGQLRDLAEGMRGVENLREVVASTSDNDVVTAASSAGATEGVHTIVVNQLAMGERLVHTAGLAAETSNVGAAKSTALDVNGVADADATWFTTTGNGATYTFDFGTETDIDSVVFSTSTAYTMNQAAALINVRSQAVSGYDAASVEFDAQTSKYYLRLTAELAPTTGIMTQALTAGDAIAELNDNTDWTKTAVATGTLKYTYDSTVRTLNAVADTTLEELRDLINNDGQNPGVTASILEYNSAFHLVLAGNDTGSDYGITIDNLATTLEGFDTPDFVQSQSPQDNEFRVDGYPAAAWIQRSSNTVTDVLTGVTLTLKAVDTATITLTRDTSGVKQSLDNLVAIYNGLTAQIGIYAGYDAENETRGILQGDMTVRDLAAGVRNIFISGVAGFWEGDGGDSFTLPGHIGIQFDDEGDIEVDDTIFSDALSDDYLGVLALTGALGIGDSDSTYITFVSSDNSATAAGAYEVEVDFDGGGTITAARIRQKGEVDWLAMSIVGAELTGVGGTTPDGLVLTAVWDGVSATQTATVYAKKGIAAAIYDETEDLLDEIDGAVKLKKDQFETAIKRIEQNIKLQERRLEGQEKRLKAKFARLEMILAQLDGQRAVYESLFRSLAANNRSSS